jgi:uncharacterized protein (TIGR03089 family)
MTASDVDRAGEALLTYYDDAAGERTALTAGELGDWAAATAALLTEGCGLHPGSRAAVLLPPHWQTAAVLLGAWAAGIEVSYQGAATAGLSGSGGTFDATFVAAHRIGSWLEEVPDGKHQFVVGLAPHGGPTPDVPAGYRDYLAEVVPYTAAGSPRILAGDGDSASVDGTTYREWSDLATSIAAMHDVGPGDRVLIDAARNDQPVRWLLAPLSVGASIVLCANLDPAARAARIAAEGVTRSF